MCAVQKYGAHLFITHHWLCFFCHDAARSHLVEHLGGKVVVDGEAEPVILRVVYLVLAKRHVADGEVIKAGAARRLKARHGDVCLGVKLLCYAPGDAVQLYAVELAALHRLRQQAEEVADAHRRLYVPTDFDTKEKALSGAKAAEKGLK